MNNLGVLVPIIALMIPIVAIVMSQWRRVQERKLDLLEKGAANSSAAAQERMQRLEERVSVLERIATDKRLSLSDEIDRLGR